MAWDFSTIEQYMSEYAGDPNLAGMIGLFEWSAEDGLILTDYPVSRTNIEPTEDAPAGQVARIWVKINNGAWQQITDIASVTNVGFGTVGALVSGISAAIVIQGAPTMGIALGIALGHSDTINTDIPADLPAGQAIPFGRWSIASDGTLTEEVAFDDLIASGAVNALGNWLDSHTIDRDFFATRLSAANWSALSTWLLAHTRREFITEVLNQWG